LHPGLRILVCQHACHRPGQAGMLRRERTVKRFRRSRSQMPVIGRFRETNGTPTRNRN
jgi:hypothetical protein